MDQPPEVHPTVEIESVCRISSGIQAGNTPPRRQIEQTLERGFAQLMHLEAELRRRGDAEAGTGESNGPLEGLREAVAVLREALTVLRTLSSPPGPPRIGYGFVLPGASRGKGARDFTPPTSAAPRGGGSRG